MTYYIEQNEKIVLFDIDRSKLLKTLSFMPQYSGLEIKKTDRPIENFEFADTPEYIAKKEKQQLEQQVNTLEQQYQMYRWQREMILAEGSSASDYAKAKAQEIEDLAEELRK